MTTECDRIGGINLAQGVCDTPVPEPVEAEAHAAIRAGHNIYTRLDGIARLRNAIAAKQQRDYGLKYDPETEVLVASGATGGLHAAAMALLNPGDEVLLFEPFYGYHVATFKSLRVKPVIVPLTEPDWALDADALHAAITPKTTAILLNTPANPSGKVFSRAEIEAGRCCLPRPTTCSCSPTRFMSTSSTTATQAHLPGNARRHARADDRDVGILEDVFDHRLAAWLCHAPMRSGWRRWHYFHDLTYVCAPSAFQHGAAAGLEQLPPSFYTQLASDHQSKRERILAALRAAGMEPSVPPGAYYVLAKAEHLPGKTAALKARHLLAETGVAAVAGSAFFRPGRGEDLLRFCFAKKDADLDEACARLKAYSA